MTAVSLCAPAWVSMRCCCLLVGVVGARHRLQIVQLSGREVRRFWVCERGGGEGGGWRMVRAVRRGGEELGGGGGVRVWRTSCSGDLAATQCFLGNGTS